MRQALLFCCLLITSCSSAKQPELSGSDPAARRDAVKALRRTSDPLAVLPKLSSILQSDPDEGVRIEAIKVLGELRVHQATELLLRVASDQHTADRLRGHALDAIAQARDPSAIPGLIEMWRTEPALETNSVVQPAIDRALVGIGLPAAEPMVAIAESIESPPLARISALHVLEQIGNETVRGRMEALARDKHPIISSLAERVLSALDRTKLQAGLRSTNSIERRSAIREFAGGRLSQDAIKLLGPVLRGDPDIGVRQEAAAILGELHLSEATEILLDIATRLEPLALRLSALAAIERSQDPAAVVGLIKIWGMQRHKDDEVVHAAVTKVLIGIGPPAIGALEATRYDSSPRIRALAHQTLKGIGDHRE